MERPVTIDDILGVEFRCRCGGRAKMEVTERGLLQDVNDPEVEIRTLLQPLALDRASRTGWVLRRADRRST